MGIISTLYASFLLSIADVSVRLFAPPDEYFAAQDPQRYEDSAYLSQASNRSAWSDVC